MLTYCTCSKTSSWIVAVAGGFCLVRIELSRKECNYILFSYHLALTLTLHALLFFCPLSHFQEESPLSVSSPEWLHYTSGVGTGRRRRRSGEQITSSPVSPKSLAFTSSIFGSWQQVFKLYFIKRYCAFQAGTNCL